MIRVPRILPGKTIGILGGGQLGRMLAQSARQFGYRVVVFSPEADSPAGQLADEEVVARYKDLSAVGRFASRCDVVTFEFEQVPATAAKAAQERSVVRPDPEVLFISQNRIREKTEVQVAGFETTPFHPVRVAADLTEALSAVGTPAVLKTALAGYDGKGQTRVGSLDQAKEAFEGFGEVECVLEAFVPFERELSVVLARGARGEVEDYGVFENHHVDHILDTTVTPPRVSAGAIQRSIDLARGLAERLEVVGVICVELFLRKDGEILFNEFAPRPHNSGHLTIEGFDAHQFEQQLRAVCGLPLGRPRRRSPAAAMANLLGDLWTYDLDGVVIGEPNWAEVLRNSGVHLHLYGKRVPRPGRKMGHVTVLGESPEAVLTKIRAARSALLPSA